MVTVKTPINTRDVKERAARKLSQLSASQDVKNIRPMVKPIHVSKTDPLVRRIMGYKKSN